MPANNSSLFCRLQTMQREPAIAWQSVTATQNKSNSTKQLYFSMTCGQNLFPQK
jgi:hypothetical protein